MKYAFFKSCRLDAKTQSITSYFQLPHKGRHEHLCMLILFWDKQYGVYFCSYDLQMFNDFKKCIFLWNKALRIRELNSSPPPNCDMNKLVKTGGSNSVKVANLPPCFSSNVKGPHQSVASVQNLWEQSHYPHKTKSSIFSKPGPYHASCTNVSITMSPSVAFCTFSILQKKY